MGATDLVLSGFVGILVLTGRWASVAVEGQGSDSTLSPSGTGRDAEAQAPCVSLGPSPARWASSRCSLLHHDGGNSLHCCHIVDRFAPGQRAGEAGGSGFVASPWSEFPLPSLRSSFRGSPYAVQRFVSQPLGPGRCSHAFASPFFCVHPNSSSRVTSRRNWPSIRQRTGQV